MRSKNSREDKNEIVLTFRGVCPSMHAEIVVETGDIQQIDHALLHVRLVDIFGYTFSAAAVSPDSNKVSAIKN